MEVIEVTHGHLRGKGIFMELKDILKTKQLSLSFFVVLDALEISKPKTSSATWAGEKAEIQT
jgi:hypothetical protein